ncbi:SDR family oxidoreductase [Paenactinomyces guangxiensis]|uniref:SDR family oxidoreductase n=1 Tax=Paenactinomyces guangxiensis TaxID=1490290 RepID=A0A7W2A906_9BACL|nr:SDR family oxidoreductase [Paenactinomyces guangxiensis]MBA4494702.1 SDR family oxidoreductase [Paenactinomyces guangxiensis]MBH8591786.1 SDR family oxidoreductase [Paenactinomyces guangxiensis]
MHINDLFSLQGKTAIVTGGGRGLGEQISIGLAEAGANVVVCSRKIEACQKVSDRLKELGVQSLALPCDVTDPAAVQQVVEKAAETFGGIDILVNNSGVSWGAPALEMPLEKFKMVMDVNVTGTFLMSQAVGRKMAEQRSGKIINIASVAGLGGTDPRILDAIGYHASKGAVIAFTKDLACKLAPYDVRINAIAPGFFPTKMSKAILEYRGKAILEQTPLKRFGTEHDLKGAVVYLASPASDYVTGHVLVVDGGTQAM